MTFEEFQATRHHTDDIGRDADFDLGEIQSGYLYESDLHIFDMPDGRFLLVIGREEWISETLEPLERRLWEWSEDEEIFR